MGVGVTVPEAVGLGWALAVGYESAGDVGGSPGGYCCWGRKREKADVGLGMVGTLFTVTDLSNS